MVGKVEHIFKLFLLLLDYDSDIMQVDRLAGDTFQPKGRRFNDRKH